MCICISEYMYMNICFWAGVRPRIPGVGASFEFRRVALMPVSKSTGAGFEFHPDPSFEFQGQFRIPALPIDREYLQPSKSMVS